MNAPSIGRRERLCGAGRSGLAATAAVWIATTSAVVLLGLGPMVPALAYTREKKDAAEEIQKKIESIEKALSALQEQELGLSMKIAAALQKAGQNVQNPEKVGERIAKGERRPADLRYRAVLLAVAAQLQRMDQRLLPLLRQVQDLQRQRDRVEPPLRTMIDGLAARVRDKRRANLEKIATMFQQAGVWPQALRAYTQAYALIPEAERAKNEDLTKTLADLYEKLGKPKEALALYLKVWEKKDAKARLRDTRLAERVADLYAQAGQPAKALEIYRKLYDQIPVKKKGDRDRILKKIEEVKRKIR